MKILNDVFKNLWEHKEGMVIGGIGGYLTYLALPLLNIQFSVIPTDPSIIENVFSFAISNKTVLLFIFFGIVIGYLLDVNKKRLPEPIRRYL